LRPVRRLTLNCRRQLRGIRRVALLQAVVEHDAIVVVDDLGLVAELHRLAQPSLGDRPGIPLVQAHPAGGPCRGDAGDALSCLRGDLTGRLQQRRQVIDRPTQPPAASTGGSIAPTGRGQRFGLGLCPAQRAPGVAQQPFGVGRGAFSQFRNIIRR